MKYTDLTTSDYFTKDGDTFYPADGFDAYFDGRREICGIYRVADTYKARVALFDGHTLQFNVDEDFPVTMIPTRRIAA